MKLERITAIAAALLALGGCASPAAQPSRAPLVPMTDAVSTTTITSALEADATGDDDMPRVSKPSRSLDAASQNALDPKRTASREGKRQHAFSDYK
jgi:hypothetical protein